MTGFSRSVRVAALIAATTIGAGIFALPYVFVHAGFGASTVLLFALAGLLGVVHISYFRALRASGDEANLSSLVEDVVKSRLIRFLTFLSVIGGLTLALSAYLILGAEFLSLVFPIPVPLAMIMFWIICAGPFLMRERKLLHVEFSGAATLFLLLVIVLIYALFAGNWSRITSLNLTDSLPVLAFAPLLFALAGWPAVSEAYAMKQEDGERKRGPTEKGIIWGTMLAAAAYFIFVISAVALSPFVSEESVLGLASFLWLPQILALFGLFALWTSYLPEGLEIQRSLEYGFKIPSGWALAGVIFLPLILIAAGLYEFISVITLAGGVFIAFQYFSLVYVSRRALRLYGARAFLLDLVALFFFLAAVYEIYVFVVG